MVCFEVALNQDVQTRFYIWSWIVLESESIPPRKVGAGAFDDLLCRNVAFVIIRSGISPWTRVRLGDSINFVLKTSVRAVSHRMAQDRITQEVDHKQDWCVSVIAHYV